MTVPLFKVSYISQARGEFDDLKLNALMAVSQARNIDNDLTGVLAYGNGHFVQILEGPIGPLATVMRSIRADERHGGLAIVGPVPIARRNFPDWCMARLKFEPELMPSLLLLITDWDAHGPAASDLLAQCLELS